MSTETTPYLRLEGMRPPFFNIIEQINAAYRSQMYVCVNLLTRKLLETMIIDILLKNPGPVDVWIDIKKNHRQTLHYMLTRFWGFMKTSYKEFIPQYPKEILKEHRDTSWNIKKIGDLQAHTFVSSATQQLIDDRRERLQNLIDFIVDLREKIPESIKLVSIEEKGNMKQMSGLTIDIRVPEAFPSKSDMGNEQEALFEVVISLDPPKEHTKCRVYVKSESQAAVFELEPPVKKWDWSSFPPRKKEENLSLDASIETELNLLNPTTFRFHGLFRPYWLRAFQREIILLYRLTGSSRESNTRYDSGKCRIAVTIGENE
ncbi:MAG: hypothetical protein ACTSWA_10780 [Candidatus Thorarchaeota archaeon]